MSLPSVLHRIVAPVRLENSWEPVVLVSVVRQVNTEPPTHSLLLAPIAHSDLLRLLKVALLLPERGPPNALPAQLEDSVPLQVIVNVKSVLPVQPVLAVLMLALTILVPSAQKELTKLELLLVPAPIAQLDLPRPLLVALLLPERVLPNALPAQLEDSVPLQVIDSVLIAVKENPVLEVLLSMPIRVTFV